jgi:hypothetical protein
MGCVANSTPDRFTPGKDPAPIIQEAGWVPGSVWKGAENLAPPPGFDPQTVKPQRVTILTELSRPTKCVGEEIDM